MLPEGSSSFISDGAAEALFDQPRRQLFSFGPAFSRPRTENKSGDTGTTTKSAAISAERLMAPKFGPTSISAIAAPHLLPERDIARLKAVVTRKAPTSPIKHFGQVSARLSSNSDNSNSPARSRIVEDISCSLTSATSPNRSINGRTVNLPLFDVSLGWPVMRRFSFHRRATFSHRPSG